MPSPDADREDAVARQREARSIPHAKEEHRAAFNTRTWGMRILAAATAVQAAHVAEHVAQTWQVFGMGVPRAQAGGLLGSAIDFPWVHLSYNLAYFLAILASLVLLARSAGPPALDRWASRLLSLASLVQGYHLVEHLVQIQQTVATGTQRPSGLAGLVADNVIVHLVLNLGVWVPALLALRRLGQLRLPDLFRRSTPV
jgi:hypothetical protein